MPERVCPSCLRAWVPLSEESAECPACRHAIGMCAVVGGCTRVEAERRELAKTREYARRLERKLMRGEP